MILDFVASEAIVTVAAATRAGSAVQVLLLVIAFSTLGATVCTLDA